MSIETISIDIGNGRTIELETGKTALLAAGAVTVRQGDTIILVTACSANPRPGLDFFPLQVDYRERFSAAGKFPGGYFKREGRPTEKEILTARMTDRPLRPLFPDGFIDDVQIMSTLLSADGENEADVLSIFGASVALSLSDIPFAGGVGACRVGRVKGQFIANPTHDEMKSSDLDLVYAGVPGKAIMIEGSCNELSEDDLSKAMEFADGIITRLSAAVQQLVAKAGKAKRSYESHAVPADLLQAAREFCQGKLAAALTITDKLARQAALKQLTEELTAALAVKFPVAAGAPALNIKGTMEVLTEETVRKLILDQGIRSDGRQLDELRPISAEVGLLPRTHGSSLFKRGETQAMVTTTLGADGDSQEFDVITGGTGKKRFMLHYNFPNFSVGECGRISGPGRREIGHGALAERSVAGMIPEDFPYAVRCVSDILGSNGSSSMASVCGATLALMDAGVPMKKPVAGISVGLVTGSDGRRVFLTDILGSEDHYGDMDFKLASTRDGITGFQLDLKIAGLDLAGMRQAMDQNRVARMKILDIMEKVLATPRTEMSEHAPKIHAVKINPEKIGALIGPGGKVIRGITERTGAQIDIHDDGTVNIFACNGKVLEAAVAEVMAVSAEAEIGKIYKGVVKSIKEFGAFVEIFAGTEGLLHISEMADYRVNRVEDICKMGDFVTVKVIDIDERGRVRLSRKAALAEIN
ncbi:MAG: polyribonucleotide nucleotidyltransferase [Lentisphaeria bacterium]